MLKLVISGGDRFGGITVGHGCATDCPKYSTEFYGRWGGQNEY